MTVIKLLSNFIAGVIIAAACLLGAHFGLSWILGL